MTMRTNNQIELNFNSSLTPPIKIVRLERRRSRAQWWFQQMRSAVDKAVDWKPMRMPRPEQLYMGLNGQLE